MTFGTYVSCPICILERTHIIGCLLYFSQEENLNVVLRLSSILLSMSVVSHICPLTSIVPQYLKPDTWKVFIKWIWTQEHKHRYVDKKNVYIQKIKMKV